MNISDVIGWKFNHQSGMGTKEVDGVMVITEFPNGVPSQAKQDTWTAEYVVYLKSLETDALKKIAKQQASLRVISLQPDWTKDNRFTKQINALSDAAILLRKEQKGTATAEEVAQLDQLQSLKIAIDSITAASNLIDTDIDAGLILTEADVIASARWP